MERIKPLFEEEDTVNLNSLTKKKLEIVPPELEVKRAVRNLNKKSKIVDNINTLLEDFETDLKE